MNCSNCDVIPAPVVYFADYTKRQTASPML